MIFIRTSFSLYQRVACESRSVAKLVSNIHAVGEDFGIVMCPGVFAVDLVEISQYFFLFFQTIVAYM